MSPTQDTLQKVLFFRGPVPLLTFGDSDEAELDSSFCGSCKAQRQCGMLNEITFSKVPSIQGFPYSPKIPFIATNQRVKDLESFVFV